MPENKKKMQKWRYFNCSSKIFDSDQKVLSHFPAQTNENILPLSTSGKFYSLLSKLFRKFEFYGELISQKHNRQVET